MLKKKYYYSLKYWLLFEYGPLILIHEPSRTKTYDYNYEYPGDIITSSTMNDYVGDYDLDDLLESGIGWDEKWYTDTTYTTEVTTPYTVTGNATFYANLYKVIRFEVFDILTYKPIAVPASFIINGTSVTPISHPTYKDYTYVIKAPYESDSLTFNITVSASGYNTETFTYSLNDLDTGNIVLTRSLDPNEFNINLHWDAPRHDFDSHFYVYENGLQQGHLDYNSGKPSGYSGDATHVIEYPTGNYYALDYDDDVSTYDRIPADHRENVSGKFRSGLTYKFVVDDFDNRTKNTGNNDIKEQNCIVTITIGGTTGRTTKFQAKNDITSGYEWEVFTIAETSPNVWTITLGSNTEEIL